MCLSERGLTVENVADRLEILELFSRYAFAMDEVDPEGVANCFTQDGLWVSHFHGTYRGRDIIKQLNERRKEKVAANPDAHKRHYILNPIIIFEGDRARFRAYMLGTLMQGNKIHVALTGHYHGTVVKEGGHWKFAERHAIPDSTETGWA
jgi:uncharacterized protein (TIGR02246 family)